MNNFFKVLMAISVLIFGLSACDSSTESREKNEKIDGAKSGGLYKMSLSDDILSIFPHNLVDADAFNLMNQVYEGLLSLDEKANSIRPELAESYSISDDGLIYTFKLKEGVFFHDDQVFKDGMGREVMASDVVYCFKKLCEPSENNAMYPYVLDLIKGASEHYNALVNKEFTPDLPEGLRVIDEKTLEIELVQATPNFLAVLTHPCCWIFPRELYDYSGDINSWCVGTGPFKARTIKMNEVVILERNEHYHKADSAGNALPYLDAVRCNFIEDENQQLDEFLSGNLDMIFRLPRNKIKRLQERSSKGNTNYEVLTIPGMRVEYYGFQHRTKPFDNANVRRAINFAIDREFLADSVLDGFGEPAIFGFVPPSTPGYNSEKIAGYEFNPEKAAQLLKEAGYEDLKDFPVLTVQINDGNPTALEVAEAIQDMLFESLGLTVELSILPRDKHYEEIENGTVAIWRDGWIADYPDPENFLRLFYGKLVPDDSVKASYLNTVRFKNDTFDGFFELSMREGDQTERLELLREADSVMMQEAAVAPLYYEQWVWLLSNRVENLSYSPMGELDLTRVYFAN